METNLIYAIVITVLVVNIKWVLIALFFPFQISNTYKTKHKLRTGKRNYCLSLLSAPYTIWERFIMRGGWQRYMLFQVGIVPSLHIRKWVYKCLGAHIEHDVIFHFKTEIRAPQHLVVMGGQSLETMLY